MSEEFLFSPVRPIITVIWAVPAYYLVLAFINGRISFNYVLPDIIWTAGFIAFMFKGMRITYLMLLGKPAIILTDENIVSAEMNDSVSWKDVSNILMAVDDSLFRNSYITIKLRDPESYIKRIKNPFVRYYRWYTRNWKNSPIELSLQLVKGDNDLIFRTVLKYYQNNRGF